MPYTPIDFPDSHNPRLKQLFDHADMYLRDAYGMFRTLPPKDGDGGGGNFSIALLLLCIIDGLAAEVWPGRDQEKKQKKRFKRLIRCKLPWGPEGKGKWVDKGTASAQLYTEFRNPLVHELAREKAAGSRPAGYVEPIIRKWGIVPSNTQDIAKIDGLPKWDNEWPILRESSDDHGECCYELSAAGLYWAVKQLTMDMAAIAQKT